MTRRVTVHWAETDTLMTMVEWPVVTDHWPVSGHAAVADWAQVLNRCSLKSRRVVLQRLASSSVTIWHLQPGAEEYKLVLRKSQRLHSWLLHCYYYLVLLQKFRFNYGRGTLYKIYMKISIISQQISEKCESLSGMSVVKRRPWCVVANCSTPAHSTSWSGSGSVESVGLH